MSQGAWILIVFRPVPDPVVRGRAKALAMALYGYHSVDFIESKG